MADPNVVTVGGRKTLDANKYAIKKTLAQGSLDITLLTVNASQLRHILHEGERHEFYRLILGLTITSLLLQLVPASVSLVLNLLRDFNLDKERRGTSPFAINHLINLISALLIVVINVFISVLGPFRNYYYY